MRVFLGVKLPGQIRHELTARLDSLEPGPGLRWVPPSNWHLTLLFLGDWPQSRCNELEKNMIWSNQVPGFGVELGPLGQFPEQGPLRVLFLQVRGGRELNLLADRVATTATRVWPDGQRDKKQFHPHLTLARGARTRVPDLQQLRAEWTDHPFARWWISGFSLFSSTRRAGSMLYREESFFPLRK